MLLITWKKNPKSLFSYVKKKKIGPFRIGEKYENNPENVFDASGSV